MQCDDTSSGERKGALTIGEAKTLAGMIAGVGPEPVEAFVLVSLCPCPDCGHPHSFRLDRSVDKGNSLMLLTQAITALMMGSEHGNDE